MPKCPPWPNERVMQSVPFEYTGVYYFGPMYVKYYTTEAIQGESPVTSHKESLDMSSNLFTCFAVVAVHLELASEEFLLCLHRFFMAR